MADSVTKNKMLAAFDIDEKLMDRYEAEINASGAEYNKAITQAIEAALSGLITDDEGLVKPTAQNLEALRAFGDQVEGTLKANGLEININNVIGTYEKRLDSLNALVKNAGLESATVSEFQNFETINKRINEFATRVAQAPGPIADEVRQSVVRFRNDLSSGEGARFADLVDTLTTKAGILPNYSRTIGNTELMGIDREARFIQSNKSGLRQMRYTGPLDGLTRPFCRAQLGEVRDRATWESMRNNTGPQPVSRYAGGYNCRHRLLPWNDDWPLD